MINGVYLHWTPSFFNLLAIFKNRPRKYFCGKVFSYAASNYFVCVVVVVVPLNKYLWLCSSSIWSHSPGSFEYNRYCSVPKLQLKLVSEGTHEKIVLVCLRLRFCLIHKPIITGIKSIFPTFTTYNKMYTTYDHKNQFKKTVWDGIVLFNTHKTNSKTLHPI